jgi:F-type H+-transporting ATPase subunit gamma
MANLKNIKLKIQSYKKTGTVTHAMEAVSAVKMRKAQDRAFAGRAYAAAALTVLERVSGSIDVARHPLIQTQENSGGDASGEKYTEATPPEKKVCFVVITSDKGLAGALNSSVIRRVESEMTRLSLAKEDVVVIAMGRRGAEYFASRGYDVRLRQENVSDSISEMDMRVVTDTLLQWHASSEIATAVMIYTNFLSTFEQEAVARQIIPITPALITEMIAAIRPARGRYVPAETVPKTGAPTTYTIEPDADTVLAVLLPQLLNIAVFHGMLESKASEHSARMVAMKSATDKAADMAKSYTRTYNKIRQASITAEVSEITSGMEAMK